MNVGQALAYPTPTTGTISGWAPALTHVQMMTSLFCPPTENLFAVGSFPTYVGDFKPNKYSRHTC